VQIPRAAVVAALLILACLFEAAAATAAKPPYVARKIASFREPVYVAGPRAGGRLFVVERAGRIRVVRRGKVLRRPFLDIRDATDSSFQRGLLSVAFAPNYRRSGRFYVFYVGRGAMVMIDEYRRSRANPSRAAPATRRHLLSIGPVGIFHHGGQLQFGPDGMLYISTGVSDHHDSAQDLGDLQGKLLRIDPRPAAGRPYTVPADNPFVFTAGARPEIWAYGLRNPWRFSFDRRTGDLTIGDVGENEAEEIDFLRRRAPAGANFGYRVFEGRRRMIAGPPLQRYVPPVIEHRHGPPIYYCAVVGGYVVRDRRLGKLYGRYLYSDLCTATFLQAKLSQGRARRRSAVPGLFIPGPISFGEDHRGRIYVITAGNEVYRLARTRRRRR
jgi:glucose/arabinose dehydrogenase